MRLLVTGSAGMLGRDVVAAARSAGHDVTGFTRADLDITDSPSVQSALKAARPEVVLNCAAWTAVDAAESDEAAAGRVNAHAPGVLAAAARTLDAGIVHISTDYVFAGDGTTPYVESDPVADRPATAYGRTKLAGEQAVRAAGGRAAIVRTAWVFGPGGKNFVDTMRRLASERDEVSVIDDQRGSPTYTGHLAAALIDVAERGLTGTLHLSGGGDCTWYDLAAATFAATGSTVTLKPTDSATFASPAPRPAYSVLTTERDDAPPMPAWQDGLAAHLKATQEISR